MSICNSQNAQNCDSKLKNDPVLIKAKCWIWELSYQTWKLQEHPRNLIPSLLRQFYHLGWVTGTGGGISMKLGDEIFIAPSGVQKERVKVRFERNFGKNLLNWTSNSNLQLVWRLIRSNSRWSGTQFPTRLQEISKKPVYSTVYECLSNER